MHTTSYNCVQRWLQTTYQHDAITDNYISNGIMMICGLHISASANHATSSDLENTDKAHISHSAVAGE